MVHVIIMHITHLQGRMAGEVSTSVSYGSIVCSELGVVSAVAQLIASIPSLVPLEERGSVIIMIQYGLLYSQENSRSSEDWAGGLDIGISIKREILPRVLGAELG